MWAKIRSFSLRILEKFVDIVWSKMEFNRIFFAFSALFRSAIRLLTYPVIWIDSLIEYLRQNAIANSKKPKQPTQRQIRSRMISVIIDGIVSNKDSVLGNRAVNRLKAWAIVFLEFASFITTAIGMTIVASDISPAIAIIWALVIQGLAGALSGLRGKWNNVILAMCLVFSIASDYVCYVNAVSPYDSYIENQYTTFKTSYDLAWERAIEITRSHESSDETIDIAFDNVDRTISVLNRRYSQTELDSKIQELNELKIERANTEPTRREAVGYDTTYNPITGQRYTTTRYSSPVENPRYKEIIDRISVLDATKDKFERMIADIREIENDISKMNANGNTGRERAKKLLADIQSLNAAETDTETSLNNEFSVLSGMLIQVQKRINEVIMREEDGSEVIEVHDLTETKRGNSRYNTIVNLKLPDFSTIRDDIANENNSVFDKLFVGFAMIIDSDFAANAVDMKKKAEILTSNYYEKFMETTAGLVLEDMQLHALIFGDAFSDIEADGSSSVKPLNAAYDNVEYRDALSKAFDYLLNPGDKVIETYSRVVYACLADGLVLLIGFSLRRKRTSIFRIHNHRDLTNEEPRLISEALYNLAARPINDDDSTSYKVKTLLTHLNRFIANFEPEPFMHDTNLKINFSMICAKEGGIKELNSDFKELICLLQTLKYIKPISVEQYNFFKQYQLNKASVDRSSISKGLPPLSGKDDKYYYLMTEGFSLYLSEKINDLYQHIETDNYKDEIIKELNPD